MSLPPLRLRMEATDEGAGDAIRDVARDAEELGGAVEKSGKAAKRASVDMEALESGVNAAAAAITAAIAAAGALVISYASAADKIAKTARSIGISGEAFQEITFALGQVAGMAEDQTAQAFRALSTRMGQAAAGNVTLLQSFARIGISQQELASGAKDLDGVFAQLSAALQETSTPAEATALAAQFLGEEASRLGPILRDAGSAVDDSRAKLRALGGVLSGESLAAAEAFNDKLDDVSRQFGAVGAQIASELLPPLNILLDRVQTNIIPALAGLAGFIGGLADAFGSLPAPIQEVAGVIVGTFGIAGSALIAVKGFAALVGATVAATGPIGLFIAAASLLTAAWVAWGDDITAALKPVIDWINEAFRGLINTVNDFIAMLVAVPQAVANALTGAQAASAGSGNRRGGATSAPSGPSGVPALLARPDGPSGVPPLTFGSAPPGAPPLTFGSAPPGAGASPQNDLASGIPGLVQQQVSDAVWGGDPWGLGVSLSQGFVQGTQDGLADLSRLFADAMKTPFDHVTEGLSTWGSEVLDTMAAVFQGSKPIAIAQALVNTFLGITQALKLDFPLNIAAAAKVAAQGFAAVAGIRSARPGGGRESLGGAGGGSTAGAVPPTQLVRIQWDGPASARVGIEELIRTLNEAGRRGYVLDARLVP